MREIIFRGKGKYKDCWYYFNLIKHKKTCGYFIVDLDELTMIIDHQVDPDTVGQFTGLTDKNDNKIFEGDIFDDEDNGYLVVRWAEGYFILDCYGYYEKSLDGNAYETCWGKIGEEPIWNYELKNMEIIGNIYDNIDLVEVLK